MLNNNTINVKIYDIIDVSTDCLKDQVVWITGASAGIGAACAQEAAAHGAKVVICARSKQQLEEVKLKCVGNYYFIYFLRTLKNIYS